MLTAWDVVEVYERLTSQQWRLVQDSYGLIEVGDDWYVVTAYDGSTLRARFLADQVQVWVTDGAGAERVRVHVRRVEDVADAVEFDTGIHTATDFVLVLSYANYVVCWDAEYGYLADVIHEGGRVRVVEFEGAGGDA